MTLVYREYDQDGLDKQYERLVADDSYAIFDRWRARSDASAETRPVMLDIPYGPAPTEKLDVFPAKDPDAPILIYIHGGYWIWKDKADFRFVAEGVVDAGVTLVVINYALTPDHDMDEIVRQVRAAVAFVWKKAGTAIPGDQDRLFLSGHSAGGHLTAIAAATNWPSFDPKLPAGIVAGGIAVSGLYDLEPIRLSYLNETVGLDAAMAHRSSPLHAIRPAMPPLTLVVGGAESDEFKRQQQSFAAALTAAGNTVLSEEVAGLHHFAVIETIADHGSQLQRAVLRRIGLG
ncbi:MAG TPA: alpha/beta hydrolase [Kaistia sp.]|nr:alpha/beta hydrolase [Kaistia sp.]